MLYATPAQAPAKADSQAKGGGGLADVDDAVDEDDDASRREERNEATASFVVNQAAEPPVSRIRVPVCPSQNPRNPCCRNTEATRARGPGGFWPGTEAGINI
jgi:hypothetical protein